MSAGQITKVRSRADHACAVIVEFIVNRLNLISQLPQLSSAVDVSMCPHAIGMRAKDFYPAGLRAPNSLEN